MTTNGHRAKNTSGGRRSFGWVVNFWVKFDEILILVHSLVVHSPRTHAHSLYFNRAIRRHARRARETRGSTYSVLPFFPRPNFAHFLVRDREILPRLCGCGAEDLYHHTPSTRMEIRTWRSAITDLKGSAPGTSSGALGEGTPG